MVALDQQAPSFSLSDSIRSKLNRKPFNLQGKIISRAQKVLSSKISFALGKQQYSNSLLKLKAKYGILKLKNIENMQEKSQIEINDGIPRPQHVIFPSENIELTWSNQFKVIGSGLANMGNTCYLNSTLQCLTYTPPLANYVVKYSHCEQCKIQGFCMICEICKHIKFSLSKVYNVYKPLNILRNLKCIAKHFNPYKQEDAHEFFIHIIEALHNSGINGYAKLDKYSKQTTLINQIFGGYLRSRVICNVCHQPSDCYDPYVDISLDVKGNSNLQYALKRFVSPELIQNDNAYKCEKCKVKVPAIKQVSIHKPSNVCVFHLKRFTSSGHKINHFVEYPEKLNLTPYLSPERQQGLPITYQLYAVLVHSGSSTHYGHYYCFCKGQNGFWYRLDDANVSQISVANVLRQEAYILFYIKDQPTTISLIPQIPVNVQKKAPIIANHTIQAAPYFPTRVLTPSLAPPKKTTPTFQGCANKAPPLVPYPDSPPPQLPLKAQTSPGPSILANQRELGNKSSTLVPVKHYSPSNVGIIRTNPHEKVSFTLKPRLLNAPASDNSISKVSRPLGTPPRVKEPVPVREIPLPQATRPVDELPAIQPYSARSSDKCSAEQQGTPPLPSSPAPLPQLALDSEDRGDETKKRKKKHKHKHKKHLHHHQHKRLKQPDSSSPGRKSCSPSPPALCPLRVDSTNLTNNLGSNALYPFPYRKNDKPFPAGEIVAPTNGASPPHSKTTSPPKDCPAQNNGDHNDNSRAQVKAEILKIFLNRESKLSMYNSKVKTWDDNNSNPFQEGSNNSPLQPEKAYTNGFGPSHAENKFKKIKSVKPKPHMGNPFQSYVDYQNRNRGP